MKTARNRFAAASRPASDRCGILDLGEVPRLERAEHHNQHQADRQIDRGAGERDHQFLAGIARQTLHARHAADRQQRDDGRLYAVAPGREDMAELVQDHAQEQKDNEERAVERGAGAVARPGGRGDPGEEQREGDMDLDGGPADAADGEGPGHRTASRSRTVIVALIARMRSRSTAGRVAARRPPPNCR